MAVEPVRPAGGVRAEALGAECRIILTFSKYSWVFMSDISNLINSVAALLSAVAWPIAVFSVAFLLRRQLVELMGRVENLNFGDKSIKFRDAAISGVVEAIEHLGESQEDLPQNDGALYIDDSTRELIDYDPRQVIINQWDRVGRALNDLSEKYDVDIDLRSMSKTAIALKEKDLISEELGLALGELYKSCKYARRVYDFDLPKGTVENYARATNEVVRKLRAL